MLSSSCSGKQKPDRLLLEERICSLGSFQSCSRETGKDSLRVLVFFVHVTSRDHARDFLTGNAIDSIHALLRQRKENHLLKQAQKEGDHFIIVPE